MFDPFDLTRIEIRFQNRSMGHGVPQVIGRHTRHPMVKPEPDTMAPSTGIDYLNLVAERHADELARLHPPIDYRVLVETAEPNQCPGQLAIPTNDRTRS